MRSMTKYRSILAVVFAVVAVFVISVSNPVAAKPLKKLTYTPEQITEIQNHAGELTTMRDRFPELADLIQQKDWTFVRNFIHGPLGEIRIKMSQITRDLLPDAQKKAREVARDIADDLVDLDQAAAASNYKLAVRYYNQATQNLETFFSLLPQG